MILNSVNHNTKTQFLNKGRKLLNQFLNKGRELLNQFLNKEGKLKLPLIRSKKTG